MRESEEQIYICINQSTRINLPRIRFFIISTVIFFCFHTKATISMNMQTTQLTHLWCGCGFDSFQWCVFSIYILALSSFFKATIHWYLWNWPRELWWVARAHQMWMCCSCCVCVGSCVHKLSMNGIWNQNKPNDFVSQSNKIKNVSIFSQ